MYIYILQTINTLWMIPYKPETKLYYTSWNVSNTEREREHFGKWNRVRCAEAMRNIIIITIIHFKRARASIALIFSGRCFCIYIYTEQIYRNTAIQNNCVVYGRHTQIRNTLGIPYSLSLARAYHIAHVITCYAIHWDFRPFAKPCPTACACVLGVLTLSSVLFVWRRPECVCARVYGLSLSLIYFYRIYRTSILLDLSLMFWWRLASDTHDQRRCNIYTHSLPHCDFDDSTNGLK